MEGEAPPRLRVRVLGDLALEVGGETVAAPGGRRPRALLAWLALKPGLHPRSEVAALFWPDVLDESARASLRVALSAVRAALEPAAVLLTATRNRVGFARDADVWVDAAAFEALCGEGRVEAALALRRGELLAGIDDDWAYAARDAFAARLSDALAAAVASAPTPERALSLARERVAADPLSEAAHRDVMRLLAAGGDRGAALLQANRLAQRLRETLGVAPSAETRALVVEIRSGDGTDTLGAATAGGGRTGGAGEPGKPFASPALLGRTPRSAFVGRSDALGRLRAAWERARSGEARLALAAGEPGIGKTRLLAELARSVVRDGGSVLYGRCTEETLIPYQPFVEALDAYAAAGDLGALIADAGPTASELARLVPHLSPAVLAAPAVGDDVAGARYRLFEAVAAVLRAAAERRPMLVVLDDLHWADRPTLLLVAHLARTPASPPPASLLLAGAYRDTELARTHPLMHALADLRGDGLVDRVALKGLEREAIASILRERLGDDHLAEAVERETDGNPFFVEEVATHLGESGGQGIPEGVREVVGRRLDRLAPGTDELLRTASVVGRTFDLRLLGLVGAGQQDDLLDALDDAIAAGLLREVATGGAGAYEFSHAIIQDTLYEELGHARRVRIHGRVADALETLPGERLAEIAHHRLQASSGGDPERAVTAACAAAERAISQLAWEDAAALYERALDALDLGGPAPVAGGALRADLLTRLGDARMRGGERDGGRVALGAAARLAGERGDGEALARAALGYGGIGVQVFEADAETAHLLERALAARPGAGDPLRARLLARLAIERYYDPSARERLSGEAVETARRSGDEGALLAALNARHVALWDPDHLSQRLAIADELIAVATAAGDRETELQGRNWRVADLGEEGGGAAFDAEVDRHESLADELRLPGYGWYAPGWRAVRAMSAGRFAEYAPLVARAAEIGGAAQDANAALIGRLSPGIPHIYAGRFEQLDVSLMTERLTSADVALAWRSSLAWFAAERGDEAEARTQLTHYSGDAIGSLPLDANLVATLAELAETYALLGEREQGARVYARLERWADRMTATMRALNTWGHTSHYLGRLAELLGRPAEARARYEAAIAGNERAGTPVWGARPRLHLAALLAEQGDPAARDRASEALAVAAQLDLDGLVARWRPRLESVVA